MNKTIRYSLVALIIAILLPTLAMAAYDRGGLLALTDNVKLADNRSLFLGDGARADNPAVGDIALKWDGTKVAITGTGAIDPNGTAYFQLDAFRRTLLARTANYTCTATDSGYVFTNTGAGGGITITLPAVASSTGFTYRFLLTANAGATISAPTDKLVAFNDAAATSIEFNTSGEIIGNAIDVVCDGSKWIAQVSLASDSVSYSVIP